MVPVQKEIAAELVSINRNPLNIYWLNKDATKKRKRADVEQADATYPVKNPSFLTLSRTLVTCESSNAPDVAQGEETTVVNVTIKEKTPQTFTVTTRSRAIRHTMELLVIKIKDENLASVFAADCKVIRLLSKPSKLFRFVEKPTATIQIDKTAHKVYVTLKYEIAVLETLYASFINNEINMLRQVLDGILEPLPTSDEQVTPKAFYDMITRKTGQYPKAEKPPLIPELDTDLLKFQSTTVNWMLSREFVRYNPDTRLVEPDTRLSDESSLNDDALVKERLNYLSYGFEEATIASTGQKVWYNPHSGNICTKEKALEYLKEEPGPQKGRGLLSEEMGLGKTVEIVALSLMNPRPHAEINQITFDALTGREIKKAKTTLIICPETIAAQWYEEINTHAPSLVVMEYKGVSKHNLPARILSEQMMQSDIVITTYTVISREVHHALYNPSRTKRPRRSTEKTYDQLDLGAHVDEDTKEVLLEMMEEQLAHKELVASERVDYSSPLVRLEFWRIVLDEVQMVGTTATNICTTATVIPRHHTWGSSGTPIRTGLNDLNSLLAFMNISPFGSVKRWKVLMDTPRTFKQLFTDLAWRHTKAMVKDDIEIPGQQRMLLTIPFGPIEQNNYDEQMQRFLEEVNLDHTGAPTSEDWEDSAAVREIMRSKLTGLRRVCCHPSLEGGLGPVKTMDKVLDLMIEEAVNKMTEMEREIVVAQLEIGQIYEVMASPSKALKTWEHIMPELAERVAELRQLKKEKDVYRISFRLSCELLHRVYFFIASAHYQLYTPPIHKLVKGIEKDYVPDGVDPELLDPSYVDSPEFHELVKDVVVYRVLSEEEMNHQNLESLYYDKAQELRKDLLAEAINDVNAAIPKLEDDFQLPLVNLKYREFDVLDFQAFAVKCKYLIGKLNGQSEIVNKWIKDVKKNLATRLPDTVTSPTGDEYEESLYAQEHASVMLTFIQRCMEERYGAVNGKRTSEIYESVENTGALFDVEFSKKMNEEYQELRGDDALKNLIIDSKKILADNEHSSEFRRFLHFLMEIKDILEKQKEGCENFKKRFRVYNSVYNVKIEYFRRLQEISDNVRPLEISPERVHGSYSSIHLLERKIERAKQKIEETKRRLTFLRGLARERIVDENDRICCICRGVITMGSLTSCGHRYCTACLNEWLRTRSTCPMCQERVRIEDVYKFRFNDEDINVSVGTQHGGGGSLEDVSKVYLEMSTDDLHKLREIPLRDDHGSKVNAIVRQVLWLKRRDPYVQIVIFSQWGDFLDILAKFLQHNGIQSLGSKSVLPKNGGAGGHRKNLSVSLFKADPNITCFLLNAKADASGLNLVNATHVILCEPLLQTALELQAISRIHRIGQKKPTTVWTFKIKDTIEENIVLLAARKRLEFKDELDTQELAKNSKNLVEMNGERVDDADLWNSFFGRTVSAPSSAS